MPGNSVQKTMRQYNFIQYNPISQTSEESMNKRTHLRFLAFERIRHGIFHIVYSQSQCSDSNPLPFRIEHLTVDLLINKNTTYTWCYSNPLKHWRPSQKCISDSELIWSSLLIVDDITTRSLRTQRCHSCIHHVQRAVAQRPSAPARCMLRTPLNTSFQRVEDFKNLGSKCSVNQKNNLVGAVHT